jgi:hypothetical protein
MEVKSLEVLLEEKRARQAQEKAAKEATAKFETMIDPVRTHIQEPTHRPGPCSLSQKLIVSNLIFISPSVPEGDINIISDSKLFLHEEVRIDGVLPNISRPV